MIRLEFDAASVARLRVAASPVFEVVAWLGVVASGAHHPTFGDPGPVARYALRDNDIAAAATLISDAQSHHYSPDFLTPNPTGASTSLEEQLTAVRETPVEIVKTQLPERWCSGSVAAYRWPKSDDVAQIVAAGLGKFWRLALADDWPHIERRLNDQVRRCGTILAEGGVDALLNSLHPSARWHGHTLTVAQPLNAVVRLHDDQTTITPSILTLPHLTVRLDRNCGLSVTFPAHNTCGRHHQAATRNDTQLLGRRRTSVLSALQAPKTTRELARDLHIAESTVSHHLKALLRAELAANHRRGRGVIYTLTPFGSELVSRIERFPQLPSPAAETGDRGN